MVIKKYLMAIKGIISHTEETPTRRILFDHFSMNIYRQKIILHENNAIFVC